jgi:hypothetical protein
MFPQGIPDEILDYEMRCTHYTPKKPRVGKYNISIANQYFLATFSRKVSS